MSTEKKSPQRKRPQLGVDELHQLRWLLGGTVTLVSVWSMFYLDIDAWVLMGVITLTTIGGLVWPQLPARVPTFLHTFAFPLIVAFFLGDLWLKGDTLPAIVRLDLLLLLYRGISYRQRREDLQIIVLGLFLIVVAGVLTVSMLFAVQLLAFAACALALLLVLTLLQGIEEGGPVLERGATPTWTDVKWSRLFAQVRAVTDWRVVVLGGLLFVGVVGVSTLLFVLIPRFQLQNSLFLERFIVRKARTGFSDSIKFGDVTEIQQDAAVALSVDVSDRALVPTSAYWRMVVLDQYEKGGTFKLSSSLRGGFSPQKTKASLEGTARLATPADWIFYLEPGVSRYLPLIGAFTELQFNELQNYQFNRAIGVVSLRDEPSTMTAYRVKGFENAAGLADPEFAKSWAERKASPALLQIDLDGLEPADQRELAKVVAEILSTSPPANRVQHPASDFIAQATSWLRRNHSYSLSPRVPGGLGDPLVRWLTSREAGHCELFAGSLVLLARSAGFPARVITGFRGGSWNGYSNNLTLRNSDAHAWAEIFDEQQRRWIRADALAAPSGSEGSTASAESPAQVRRVDRGWSARIESLRVFWYRRIVSFDRQSQVETLLAIKEGTEKSGRQLRETLRQALADLRLWWTSPWNTTRVLQWLGLAAALFGARWAWREFGRGIWRRWFQNGRGRAPDPVRLDASRWLAKLARIKVAEPEDERVRGDLQRLRFGARASWSEPRQVFRRAKRVVRAARGRRPTGSQSS
ncbi:MAG: transglutaminaseTgpA domain-containing protein [Opitutaceae bacterium]